MAKGRIARRIAIIVPAYNEEVNVRSLYEEVYKTLSVLSIEDWKIIFVDDGSQDKTLPVLKKLSKEGKVGYISFSRNYGHQTALKAGLDYVAEDYDLAITMDADLQHPPKLLPELLRHWEEGYDVVYTIRQSTDGTGLLKNLTSRIFYRLFRRLTGIELEEGAADFRLYDKQVLLALRRYKESSLFLRGIVATIGFKQKSIFYKAGARTAGQSSYSFKKMFVLALNGITSFSTKPLRMAVFIGFTFSCLSVLYGLYALVIWTFGSQVVPGWASITAGLAFLGGLQLMFMGIIGVYIGKIFDEVKNRPMYLVKDTNLERHKK